MGLSHSGQGLCICTSDHFLFFHAPSDKYLVLAFKSVEESMMAWYNHVTANNQTMKVFECGPTTTIIYVSTIIKIELHCLDFRFVLHCKHWSIGNCVSWALKPPITFATCWINPILAIVSSGQLE